LVRLLEFLDDAKKLGTVRFINISPGAVLETIGRFDYSISTFAVPTKGTYLTIASPDKLFECHINTDKVKSVTLATEKAKLGDYDLHVVRLKGEEPGAPLLSCVLQWNPSEGQGVYLAGAVEKFQELVAKYGGEFAL